MTVSVECDIMWKNILVYRCGIFIVAHMKFHGYFAKNVFCCRWYGFYENFIHIDDKCTFLFLSKKTRKLQGFPYPSGSEFNKNVYSQFPKWHTYQLIIPPRKWDPLRSLIILASSIIVQSQEAIRKVTIVEYLQSTEIPALFI